MLFLISCLFVQVDSNFPQLRRRIVTWIADLNEKFEFSPETLFLTVAVFDRFLVSVKVGVIVFLVHVLCYNLLFQATCCLSSVAFYGHSTLEDSECIVHMLLHD